MLAFERSSTRSMVQVYAVTAPPNLGLAPPPGVVPAINDDPFTINTYQKVAVAGCIISTTVLVVGRMYAKRYIMRSLVWEDCGCSE